MKSFGGIRKVISWYGIIKGNDKIKKRSSSGGIFGSVVLVFVCDIIS